MSAELRPVRDIVAEAMRRERLELVRPLWGDWYEEAREPYRQRADHLIRLLADAGIAVVRVPDPQPHMPPPSSPVIWRFKLVGRNAERLVRRANGDLWEIVTVEDGQESVEQTFTLQQASINGSLVLIGDPAAKTIPGLGSQLAAVLEIFRLDAAAMEPAS